jgi:hypothetical protein
LSLEEILAMNEALQEFVHSRGVDIRVDSHAGVIRGGKLLGLESRNGRRYLPTALAEAVPLYEGSKVNVNHPKGSPLAARDYQDRLGSIRNVRCTPEGLFGDLHYNPKHALAEQLVWDATHAPENVGLSHNVEARTSRTGGQTIVEAILQVQSVDLVADPATTRSLFESTGDDGPSTPLWLPRLTLESLVAARPDLVEAIRNQQAEELARLREEVDRLRCEAQLRRRRDLAVALLREFDLPDPAAATGSERELVSEEFLEVVLAANDEAAMRRLVEDRARLVAAARGGEHSVRNSRPVSREQHRGEAHRATLDARSFARAIS